MDIFNAISVELLALRMQMQNLKNMTQVNAQETHSSPVISMETTIFVNIVLCRRNSKLHRKLQ